MRDFIIRLSAAIIALCCIFWPSVGRALSLEEAITLAKESLPTFRAAQEQAKSYEARYRASLSPYFPSIDASSSHARVFTSSSEYRTQTYDLTLGYTLFDWGRRSANRNIASLDLEISAREIDKTLLDIELAVKTAYRTSQALAQAVELRRIQLNDAEKDYEVANSRYTFGVAKLSDVLQASVRREQARYNLIEGEGNLKKALSDLNSLIGKPLDAEHELERLPETDPPIPDLEQLVSVALKRPEIEQAERAVRIQEQSASLIRSTFFPTFSFDATYRNTGGDRVAPAFREEKIGALTATWNIFELGKFYEYRSAKHAQNVSTETLNDLKRRIVLDVRKTFEEFLTAQNKLVVARAQLQQAEHNYAQAFGEYRVGKADILSLIQAERFLADAREQLVLSRLNLMLSKALLERTAGIPRLESLSAVDRGVTP